MKKIELNNAQVTLHMQEAAEFRNDKIYNGIFSTHEDGSYLFEEAVASTSHPRNPKLYDGQYITLVRMRNGRYQPHLKTLNIEKGFKAQEFAEHVYTELLNALTYVNK